MDDSPDNPGAASPPKPVQGRDPWAALQRHTAARIALGRAGASQRTVSVLDFRLAHARARDAVHASLDLPALARQFAQHGLDAELLATAVSDKAGYLLRPDLGRRLDDASRERLRDLAARWGRRDLAIVISDGLAAQSVARHAVETVTRLVASLGADGWTVYPLLLVPFGRVKLQDEIGFLLGARHSLMLLGERPGLGAPDSLGAYFTHRPRPECTDADRNCISNIRPAGLPPAAAAGKLARLLTESARRGTSGVALKDSGGGAASLS
ncbi:ethanolamine ammonia-lyase [Termitidicoccus mucosus]|uniref:Ethanolamine ammonia-lyase small subunit n=2 Tax=Termitidicoccus mucosus TaxID=1184151 RepID=A0A178IB93_9BACT|nr:ethanolamine ammonia-lyase [Opitutaceae bacterium TSB47]